MSIEQGRRHSRVRVRLQATLVVGRRELAVVTEDISRGGLRVLTDSPPPERCLVQFRTILPGDTAPTSFSGVTLRAVRPGGETPPGVSVQFHGNAPELMARWERFVRTVPGGEEGARGPVVATARAVPTVPARRGFERVQAVFEVHTPAAADLLPFASRDVSKGGMFLVADVLRAVGETLGLAIVHPTGGGQFELRCVVRRVVRERALGIGMGVEFLDLDAARRDELWEFLSGGFPVLDDAAIVMLDEEFDALCVEVDVDDERAADARAHGADRSTAEA